MLLTEAIERLTTLAEIAGDKDVVLAMSIGMNSNGHFRSYVGDVRSIDLHPASREDEPNTVFFRNWVEQATTSPEHAE